MIEDVFSAVVLGAFTVTSHVALRFSVELLTVIVAVPGDFVSILPVWLTVATDTLLEDHSTLAFVFDGTNSSVS